MKTCTRKLVRHSVISHLTLAILLGSAMSNAHAYRGESLASTAKITMAQARSIAVKAFPGKIVKSELEKEKGGSGLRYSFDIRHGNTTHEVGVDAQTGKVLENGSDTD